MRPDFVPLVMRNLPFYQQFVLSDLNDTYNFFYPASSDRFLDFYEKVSARDNLNLQRDSEILANLVSEEDVVRGAHTQSFLSPILLATVYLSRAEKYKNDGREFSAWANIADAMLWTGRVSTEILARYTDAAKIGRQLTATSGALAKASKYDLYREHAWALFENAGPDGWKNQSQAIKHISADVVEFASKGAGPPLPDLASVQKSVGRWLKDHPRFEELTQSRKTPKAKK